MAFDILIVDDERDICQLVGDILEDEGYSCRYAYNGGDALQEVKNRRPHLILLDIWLGDNKIDGLEILAQVVKDHIDLPVLMMSGHGNIETAVSAIKSGAYDFIEKPFKAEKLIVLVQRALESHKLQQENTELKNKYLDDDGVLLGNSSAVQNLVSSIEKVAGTNSRVVLHGQHGSGKESIARIIHNKSQRHASRFVTLNCSNFLPEELEQALLGIEKENGFNAGLLEQSHKGTLFLESVDRLSIAAQQSLLKVLQNNRFFRINGEDPVEVDVRIISSTTVDLQSLVEESLFNSELYERLNVTAVSVPSLSARAQDIPELLQYYGNETAKLLKVPAVRFSEEAILSLQQYRWVGNIRQLRTIIEWILLTAQGITSIVELEHLPSDIVSSSGDGGDAVNKLLSLPLREARSKFETDYLLAQINRFGGNVSKTADFIEMERSALHRKLKSLGIMDLDKK